MMRSCTCASPAEEHVSLPLREAFAEICSTLLFLTSQERQQDSRDDRAAVCSTFAQQVLVTVWQRGPLVPPGLRRANAATHLPIASSTDIHALLMLVCATPCTV